LKRPAKLSFRLEHHVNAYVLAASAAGVGMLALAQPVEARIVYTHTHFKCYDCKIDLNHDGITDFYFWHSVGQATTGYGSAFMVLGHSGNSVKGMLRRYHNIAASALRRGARIGGTKHFYGKAEYLARANFTYSKGGTSSGGNWVNVTNRYLGLRFQIQGHMHYGWARFSIKIKRGSPGITATLTGYAYETIPNKPIIAGKTHGPDVITLKDATLGHLARGASAIPAWRARRTDVRTLD
jgi:hypothetical protein